VCVQPRISHRLSLGYITKPSFRKPRRQRGDYLGFEGSPQPLAPPWPQAAAAAAAAAALLCTRAAGVPSNRQWVSAVWV